LQLIFSPEKGKSNGPFLNKNGVIPQKKKTEKKRRKLSSFQLPNIFRALFNGRMWFWFSHVTWDASFNTSCLIVYFLLILLMHQLVHLSIHLASMIEPIIVSNNVRISFCSVAAMHAQWNPPLMFLRELQIMNMQF